MGCMKPCVTKITYLLIIFLGSFSLPSVVSGEQPSESALQGKWWILGNVPDEIGLVDSGTHLTIQRNQIVVDSDVTATFANDLQSAKLAAEVGFDGSRVMVLTTSSGQGLICSYFIDQDVVEIAYPHTTFCHRGSGHILRITRLPKTLN